MKKKKQAVARRKPRGIELAAAAEEGAWDNDAFPWSNYKPKKIPLTVRLDADVVQWFKKSGRGYQTRINRALREAMEKNSKR